MHHRAQLIKAGESGRGWSQRQAGRAELEKKLSTEIRRRNQEQTDTHTDANHDTYCSIIVYLELLICPLEQNVFPIILNYIQEN